MSDVDEYSIASLKFPAGVLAQIAAGISLTLENNLRIVGTEGSILVPSPWIISRENGPSFSKIVVFKNHIPEEVLVEADRGLYAIEADHVAEQISKGNTESPTMPWADSLGNMATLDEWRASLND